MSGAPGVPLELSASEVERALASFYGKVGGGAEGGVAVSGEVGVGAVVGVGGDGSPRRILPRRSLRPREGGGVGGGQSPSKTPLVGRGVLGGDEYVVSAPVPTPAEALEAAAKSFPAGVPAPPAVVAELREEAARAAAQIRSLEAMVARKDDMLEQMRAKAQREREGRAALERALRRARRAEKSRLQGPSLLAPLSSPPTLPPTLSSPSGGPPPLPLPFALRILALHPALSPLPQAVAAETASRALLARVSPGASVAAAQIDAEEEGAADIEGGVAGKALLVVVAGWAERGGGGREGRGAVGVGAVIGEHSVLDRRAVGGRGVAGWTAGEEGLIALALPSRLMRRILFHECTLLNAWTPPQLADAIPPETVAFAPAPRTRLRANSPLASLGARVRALRLLQRGAKGSGGVGVGGGEEGRDGPLGEEKEGEEDGVDAIPAHLARFADLWLEAGEDAAMGVQGVLDAVTVVSGARIGVVVVKTGAFVVRFGVSSAGTAVSASPHATMRRWVHSLDARHDTAQTATASHTLSSASDALWRCPGQPWIGPEEHQIPRVGGAFLAEKGIVGVVLKSGKVQKVENIALALGAGDAKRAAQNETVEPIPEIRAASSVIAFPIPSLTRIQHPTSPSPASTTEHPPMGCLYLLDPASLPPRHSHSLITGDTLEEAASIACKTMAKIIARSHNNPTKTTSTTASKTPSSTSSSSSPSPSSSSSPGSGMEVGVLELMGRLTPLVSGVGLTSGTSPFPATAMWDEGGSGVGLLGAVGVGWGTEAVVARVAFATPREVITTDATSLPTTIRRGSAAGEIGAHGIGSAEEGGMGGGAGATDVVGASFQPFLAPVFFGRKRREDGVGKEGGVGMEGESSSTSTSTSTSHPTHLSTQSHPPPCPLPGDAMVVVGVHDAATHTPLLWGAVALPDGPMWQEREGGGDVREVVVEIPLHMGVVPPLITPSPSPTGSFLRVHLSISSSLLPTSTPPPPIPATILSPPPSHWPSGDSVAAALHWVDGVDGVEEGGGKKKMDLVGLGVEEATRLASPTALWWLRHWMGRSEGLDGDLNYPVPSDAWVPGVLSLDLRQCVWARRKEWWGRPSLLPALLRSAPLLTAEEVLRGVMSGASWSGTWSLPIPTLVQMLHLGHSAATVAAHFLARCQPCTLLPLIPSIASSALLPPTSSPSTNAASALLLRIAARYPNSIGRHALWAILPFRLLPTAKQRAEELAQAIIDSLSPRSSGEFGLQTVGLCHLASASSSACLTLPPPPPPPSSAPPAPAQRRQAHTLHLRTTLTASSSLRPFITRLPLAPTPPIVPSVWHRTKAILRAGSLGGDGEGGERGEGGEGEGHTWEGEVGKLVEKLGKEEEGGEEEGEEEEEEGEGEEDDDDEDDDDDDDDDSSTSSSSSGFDLAEAEDEVLERVALALAPLGFVGEVDEEDEAEGMAEDEGGLSGRRRWDVWGDGSGAPSVALPAAGLCMGAVEEEASRVLRAVPRSGVGRVLVIAEPRPDPLAGAVGGEEGEEGEGWRKEADGWDGEGADEDEVVLATMVPRPLRCIHKRIGLLISHGSNASVATQALHSLHAATAAKIWREGGLLTGDSLPPMAYRAIPLPSAPSTPPIASSLPWQRSERLVGISLAPPDGLSLAEILGVSEDDAVGAMDDVGMEAAAHDVQVAEAVGVVLPRGRPGYGGGRLHRFLLDNLFHRLEEGERGTGGVGVEEKGEEDGVDRGGAYTEVVQNFVHSLAAALVLTHVLALGPRRPGDVLVAPSGTLVLASLDFAGGRPDPSVHVDETDPDSDPSRIPLQRFASRALVADILAVLGQHPPTSLPSSTPAHISPQTTRVLAAATDAFLALRRRADEIIATAGAHMPLGLPGAASPHDIACLRSRLMLHHTEPNAAQRFSNALIRLLCLEHALPAQE